MLSHYVIYVFKRRVNSLIVILIGVQYSAFCAPILALASRLSINPERRAVNRPRMTTLHVRLRQLICSLEAREMSLSTEMLTLTETPKSWARLYDMGTSALPPVC